MYILYLDILGYDELANEIAEKKGIDDRDVRKKFKDVINEILEDLSTDKEIISFYFKKDDWLVIIDELFRLFKIIYRIFTHSTGYKDYEKIPFEVSIEIINYRKGMKLDGEKLLEEKEILRALKKCKQNSEFYKIARPKDQKKQSFIIFTEEFYATLPPLERKICEDFNYFDLKHNRNLCHIANIEKFIQRGKFFQFLDILGIPNSKWYGRIDDIYIHPKEYEEIKDSLKKNRLVFLTGTQEYGKTYTAIRLLWEYYNKGYEPQWIKGGEIREREEVREKLIEIERELKPSHIIYYEDPFGQTTYEKREILERDIETIIEQIKHVNDVYVIITSREEVFKEFEGESLSATILSQFEKKLNIKISSYDYEKRKEILIRWAEAENCKWFSDNNLRQLILDCLKNKENLPTPLRIRDFVIASKDIDLMDELLNLIEEKSKKTAKQFAKEIKVMSEDKILFFSFLFIYNQFEIVKINLIKELFDEIAKELNLTKFWNFNKIIQWFEGDKIAISENYIEFSHPSYSEALGYLLTEDEHKVSIIENIFCKILIKLSESNEFKVVIRTIAQFYDKLTSQVVDIVRKLIENNVYNWIDELDREYLIFLITILRKIKKLLNETEFEKIEKKLIEKVHQVIDSNQEIDYLYFIDVLIEGQELTKKVLLDILKDLINKNDPRYKKILIKIQNSNLNISEKEFSALVRRILEKETEDFYRLKVFTLILHQINLIDQVKVNLITEKYLKESSRTRWLILEELIKRETGNLLKLFFNTFNKIHYYENVIKIKLEAIMQTIVPAPDEKELEVQAYIKFLRKVIFVNPLQILDQAIEIFSICSANFSQDYRIVDVLQLIGVSYQEYIKNKNDFLELYQKFEKFCLDFLITHYYYNNKRYSAFNYGGVDYSISPHINDVEEKVFQPFLIYSLKNDYITLNELSELFKNREEQFLYHAYIVCLVEMYEKYVRKNPDFNKELIEEIINYINDPQNSILRSYFYYHLIKLIEIDANYVAIVLKNIEKSNDIFLIDLIIAGLRSLDSDRPLWNVFYRYFEEIKDLILQSENKENLAFLTYNIQNIKLEPNESIKIFEDILQRGDKKSQREVIKILSTYELKEREISEKIFTLIEKVEESLKIDFFNKLSGETYQLHSEKIFQECEALKDHQDPYLRERVLRVLKKLAESIEDRDSAFFGQIFELMTSFFNDPDPNSEKIDYDYDLVTTVRGVLLSIVSNYEIFNAKEVLEKIKEHKENTIFSENTYIKYHTIICLIKLSSQIPEDLFFRQVFDRIIKEKFEDPKVSKLIIESCSYLLRNIFRDMEILELIEHLKFLLNTNIKKAKENAFVIILWSIFKDENKSEMKNLLLESLKMNEKNGSEIAFIIQNSINKKNYLEYIEILELLYKIKDKEVIERLFFVYKKCIESNFVSKILPKIIEFMIYHLNILTTFKKIDPMISFTLERLISQIIEIDWNSAFKLAQYSLPLICVLEYFEQQNILKIFKKLAQKNSSETNHIISILTDLENKGIISAKEVKKDLIKTV